MLSADQVKDMVQSTDEEFHSQAVCLLGWSMKINVPGFRVLFKEESSFWKRLPSFFMKSHTTIGTKVYYHGRQFARENQSSYFRTLAHEYVHLLQRIRSGGVRFTLQYIKPQVFGAIPLFVAVVSFLLGHSWLDSYSFVTDIVSKVCLVVSAVLFLPWSSRSRYQIERMAYTMSLAVEKWETGTISDSTFNEISEALRSPIYYFMLKGKQKADNEVQKMIYDVVKTDGSGEPVCYCFSPAFKIVHQIIKGSNNG